MNKIYSAAIVMTCCMFSVASVAQNYSRKLESEKYWKGQIAEDFAEGIVNEIPDMIDERHIEKEQFDQSTDDAYLAKLKIRFFSFIKRDKINQARSISKMMVKKGDYTGENYLKSIE